MRSLLVISLLILCLVSRAQEFSPTELKTDFDSLTRSLKEAHGGLYRYGSAKEMEQLFRIYRGKLNHPMEQLDFFKVLNGLVSRLNDGHMRVEFDPEGAERFRQGRMLPYSFLINNNRLYVLTNDSKTDTLIRPGMELVKVNGYPVQQLLNRMLAEIPGDGFITTGRRRKLARNFPGYYWLLIDRPAGFSVVARDATGKLIDVRTEGVLTSERAIQRRSNMVNTAIDTSLLQRWLGSDGPIPPLSLQNSDDHIAALRMPSFSGERFAEELDSLLQIAVRDHAEGLILDLRGNAGGEDMNGALTVSKFVNQPFRYFDHITSRSIVPSFAEWKKDIQLPEHMDSFFVRQQDGSYRLTSFAHPGIGLQEPAENVYNGPLAVLIDGGTFSTAADVCAILRQLKRAIFIGEETGGGYYGNTSGNEAWLTLPNSRLRVRVTLYDYWNAVNGGKQGRGVMPDLMVAPTAAQLLKGKDPAMDEARRAVATQHH